MLYVIVVGLVAALAIGALPASAETAKGPTLIVANPHQGDKLNPGTLVIQGVAFDGKATEGSGVDRVSVFLDSRDTGGLHLGDAVLGRPSTMRSEAAQYTGIGWTVTTPELKGFGDPHKLFVYARSAASGAETVVTIPVIIGDKVEPSGGGEEE
jgi:hypothetical protein